MTLITYSNKELALKLWFARLTNCGASFTAVMFTLKIPDFVVASGPVSKTFNSICLFPVVALFVTFIANIPEELLIVKLAKVVLEEAV